MLMHLLETWFTESLIEDYDGGNGTQYDIALGDLNSDGKLDIIMSDNDGSIRVLYNEDSPRIELCHKAIHNTVLAYVNLTMPTTRLGISTREA